MTTDIVRAIAPLGFPWQTLDPFLFCAHHRDDYPAGNGGQGLDRPQLRGRNLGMDFEVKDGFRMYHGEMVPGFPRHPHRGFETITIACRGFVDHSDSMGAHARFGQGDVQWMSAGQGVVHSEMFPLVDDKSGNPGELFQIWLNLAGADKMRPAHFAMVWNEDIPRTTSTDDAGHETEVSMVVGAPGQAKAANMPPHSWAARPKSDVRVWTLKMAAKAKYKLAAGSVGANRVLYFFDGDSIRIDGQKIEAGHLIQLRPDIDVEIDNLGGQAELLMLHGQPIGEPVAQHGPFVMNTRAEISQAVSDYQRTQFGKWPWSSDAPVHPRESGRFAVHAGGLKEYPPKK